MSPVTVVGPFAEELCGYLKQLDPDHRVSISVEVEEVVVGLDEAVPVGIIVQEAVRNSFEHAFPASLAHAAPEVRVRVCLGAQKQCVVEIRDNGIGFDRDRTRLQLGFVFMEAVADQVSGQLEVTSDQSGTTVRFNARAG
ncbi:MAG: ATP-binding protein [Spirochaetales bacterium]